jgi:UDP-N-acetylmuramate--alanine ligase
VAEDNPELEAARRAGIPVMRRRRFLAAFAVRQAFLSVAGTHGKTTTSSMLAVALRGAGEDPSFLIGAPVPVLGGAAAIGGGRWMVVEADESDGSFLAGPRAGAVLTNAEPDHLEHWGGWEQLRAAFVEFLAGTSGPVVVCGDDRGSASLGAELGVVSYGTGEGATYRMAGLEMTGDGSRFEVIGPAGGVEVRLGIPGAHNALNATGALALVAELGADLPSAAQALGNHSGLHRRFERRGEAAGVVVVDDYAHLPTEVRAALAAGRQSGPRRLVVVFQPHRYSRTEALWREFGPCFGEADVLLLTEIYPAGEAPREGVSGRLVLDAARTAGAAPRWAPGLDDAVELLVGELRPGDLLMTVGAGDVREVGDRVLAALAGRVQGDGAP